jgi:solute carrier family 44 (choline transporter-like protein), member 2/4/5
MGQLIVEDTINTWPVLAVGFACAALCSLIIIAIMRWVAGPIVWLSIVGVLALLSAGELKFIDIVAAQAFRCTP